MSNDDTPINYQRPSFPPRSLAGFLQRKTKNGRLHNPEVAVAAVASGRQQDSLAAGSHSQALAARRLEKPAKAIESAVLEVDANATQAMFTAERKRRAVRRGKDVYLPSWQDSAVGLPNLLLRSSLWSASVLNDGEVENAQLAVLGHDAAVNLTGPLLTQYDRRVFAACLDCYREDRPLSRSSDAIWIQVSFFKMTQSMGLSYTRNTHIAIHGSLRRLAATGLRVHKGQLELPVFRLLEVIFSPDNYSLPKAAARDQIVFRVPEQIAELYGPATWTAVPKPALKMKGLRGWLTGFYATQSVPRLVPFQTLHELSGLACRPNDFRTRLCTALDELKTPETPEEMRVARYQVSPDRKSIIVSLVSWATSSNAEEQ